MPTHTLKRLQRTALNATGLAHAMTRLSVDIDQLDLNSIEPLAADYVDVWDTHTCALAIANNKWLELTRRVQAIQAQARAASMTAGDMADAAADTVMLTEQVDEIMRLAYIPWARHTQQLLPELLDAAVREVASHEGGREKLEMLRAAIAEVLAEA